MIYVGFCCYLFSWFSYGSCISIDLKVFRGKFPWFQRFIIAPTKSSAKVARFRIWTVDLSHEDIRWENRDHILRDDKFVVTYSCCTEENSIYHQHCTLGCRTGKVKYAHIISSSGHKVYLWNNNSSKILWAIIYSSFSAAGFKPKQRWFCSYFK